MSKTLEKWIKHQDRQRKKSAGKKLSPQERLALHKMRSEAKRAGAVLANNGKGGLPPSLVLTVMRRDGYKCKIHGDRGDGENGGLTVHHKGGIVESRWLDQKGHKNQPNNIVTVCARGHDQIHEKARREGVDSTQVEPKADKEK